MDCALSNLRLVGDGKVPISVLLAGPWSTAKCPFLRTWAHGLEPNSPRGVTSKDEVPDFLVNLGHRQLTMDELNKRPSRASRATVPDAERPGGRLKKRWL